MVLTLQNIIKFQLNFSLQFMFELVMGIPKNSVLFYVCREEQDVASHPKATYCGTIFHVASNEFRGCDVST